MLGLAAASAWAQEFAVLQSGFAPAAGESFDMKLSSFRQPPPTDLAPLMSKGYKVASQDPKPFEIVDPAPAGAVSSPGEDMAHFMIAHLQDGAYEGKRILSAATARTMHDSPLTLLPPLNRMELGFFETNINAREVIAHLGDTETFHTSLHFFLKEAVGSYVSFISLGKQGAAGGLRGAKFENFADRYFPGKRPEVHIDAKTSAAHAALLTGTWINSRGSQSSFLASLDLFGLARVSVNDKGEPRHWVEIAPFVWRVPESHERLAAQSVDGKVVRLSIDGLSPFRAFYRPPWYRHAGWLRLLFYPSVAALASTVLFWPVIAITRRRIGAQVALDRPALRAYRLSKVGALLLVAPGAVWATTLALMLQNFNNLVHTLIRRSVLHRCAAESRSSAASC